MADNNDKVLALVEAELKRNPSATTQELQDKAKKKYPSAGKLSKRQFNARFALQIKRRKPGGAANKTRKKATATARRAVATAKKAAAKAARPARGRRPGRPAKAASAAPAATSSPDRDAIRQQFLRFASDITAADTRGDLVKVLANVDKYVAAVVKVAG